MNRNLLIRAALAALALVAQLVVPVGHGLGSADDSAISAHGSALTVAAPHASADSAHDPLLCPACIALHQVRSGIGCAPCDDALRVARSLLALGREPERAPPRDLDLATAPPRAPPIRSLAFA